MSCEVPQHDFALKMLWGKWVQYKIFQKKTILVKVTINHCVKTLLRNNQDIYLQYGIQPDELIFLFIVECFAV